MCILAKASGTAFEFQHTQVYRYFGLQSCHSICTLYNQSYSASVSLLSKLQVIVQYSVNYLLICCFKVQTEEEDEKGKLVFVCEEENQVCLILVTWCD